VSPKHRYQVMPDLSPEAYAALKADIFANGVRIPKEVDEEGNIIYGHQRQQICDELGIECPEHVLTGLTDAQNREYAYRMNLMRRQLTQKQKREIAHTLREEGWTQERIAQVLGVSQSTIGNWLHQFTNSGKLRQPTNVKGKDGHRYSGKKTRRRAAQPTEEANVPETPQIPSETGDRSARALAHQEPPHPRDPTAEAQSPGTEPPVAADVPDAPERPSPVSDEWHPVAVEQASSRLGSSPVLPAEADAEGWVGALQDLAVRLETLQTQGSLRSLHRRWAPEARARGMATIQRIQNICRELEAVVGADMSETAARNGPDVGDMPSPFLPPSADAVQVQGNGERVTVPSAEAPVRDVSEGDQLPSQGGDAAKPPHEPVVPVQEEAKPSTPERPQAPSTPARPRTRRSKRAVAHGQGAGASVCMTLDHPPTDDTPSTGDGTTSGMPAPHHDEDAIEPAADAERPSGVPVSSDTADSVSVDVTRCGCCGGSQFVAMSKELGHIFCECGSVYNPSGGDWAPGRPDRWRSPLAPLPTTAA
jgi:ParB-like chromosome segregation protein Spo0J